MTPLRDRSINLGGKPNWATANPYVHSTPEWHAWETGYSSGRRDAGRAVMVAKGIIGPRNERMR